VANHQKRALETQFAKAYRTLSQAVNLAIAEHGEIGSWDWKENMSAEEKDAFAKKYFLPFLNTVKFCSASSEKKTCFPDTMYKYLHGGDYYNYSTDKLQQPQAILADGTSLRFGFLQAKCIEQKSPCLTLDIDINGHKKPNVIGRDFFAFFILQAKNEFIPSGAKNTKYNEEINGYANITNSELYEECNPSGGKGFYCAARIIHEGFKINY